MDDILDEVYFFPLERLDLVDARAIGSVLNRSISDALGGIVGGDGGCVSAPVFEFETNVDGDRLMHIKAFQFFYVYQGINESGRHLQDSGGGFGDGLAKGKRGFCFAHDPTDPSQSTLSTLDISSLVNLAVAAADGSGNIAVAPNESLYPYLWVQPFRVNVSSDTRRFFNTSSGAEESVATPTRSRTRFRFQLALAQPDVALDDNGVPVEPPWMKIGRVARWDRTISSPNTPAYPRVFPISYLDSDDAAALTRQPGTSEFSSSGAFAAAKSFDGVAATSASQARAGRFGLAPVQGANSNASILLSPYPGFTSGGPLRASTTNLYNQGGGQPATLSMVEQFAVIRSVLRHLVGNPDGAHPSAWWEKPDKGIKDLITQAESLQRQIQSNDDDISALQNDRALNTGETARTIGHGLVFYDNRSGSPSYTTGAAASENLSTPTRNSEGEVTISLSVDLSQVVPSHVMITPVAPMGDGLGSGASVPDWPGYARSGFDPASHTVQYTVSDITAAADVVTFTVKFRGGPSGSLVPVDCSFNFDLLGYPFIS